MRLFFLPGLLLVLLLLVGCASAPKQMETPISDLPNAWSNSISPSGAVTTNWLCDFNDPTLEAIVTESLKHNPNLIATAARLEQALAEAKIAGADRAPTLAAGLGGTRQRISSFGPQQTGGIYYNNNNIDLNLSWEIDLWGRLNNYSSAALAEAEASSADYAGARLSLAAQTAKSWFNFKEAAAQEELAQSDVINHEKNLAALESGYKSGIHTGIELREIRTSAAIATANLLSRKRQLDQASRRLEILLGRYPSASLAKMTDLPALPASIPAGLPSELLLRRPDLIAAERRLAATDQTLRAAKKDRLPKLSLTSSAGTATSEFDDLLDSNFRVGAVAGNLINPIFQGGRIRANINRRESQKEQSIANYHNTALQAFLEVETALAGENLLRVEAEHLMLATNAAKDSLQLARQQYRSGSLSFTNMLQSERNALAMLSRYLVAHRTLLNNRIDLHLALGGSFGNEQ